ncbi:hypothetical protein LINGRAHAP2_LOCUS33820 [Linum grandiflorum]
MAISSKLHLCFIVSLLLSLTARDVVEGRVEAPRRCFMDIECMRYCAEMRPVVALCNRKGGFCSCLPVGLQIRPISPFPRPRISPSPEPGISPSPNL